MSDVALAWRNAALMVALSLVVWEALYLVVGEVAMRSPLETLTYTIGLFSGDMIWPHLHETFQAFGLALVGSVAGGLAIGFLLGYKSLLNEIFEPMLIAAYSIPKITLYPILLLMFGLGMSAKVAFGIIHGIIPIALFTINAVRNVRPVLIKAGRVHGLSDFEVMRLILFPAAIPEIFTGLRIGFALTLVGTILGEMFASQRGLGFLLMNAIGLHNVDLIMSITLTLVAFAAVASSLLLYYDQKLHRRRS